MSRHAERVSIVTKTVLRREQIDALRQQCDLTVYFDVPPAKDDVIQSRINDARIVVTNVWTPISRQTLDACPQVRAILTCSAGTDHIDTSTCAERGISVTAFPDYCVRTMAEKAFTFVLMGVNRIGQALRHAESGGWNYSAFQGRECPGLTIGVLGLGRTGEAVASLASAFGMRVLSTNSRSTTAEVAELLENSDVLSLHMSVNDRTKNFLNAERLSLVREDVVIVNVSRGALIDESALVTFLDNHPNATALLDVLATEPPPREHPLLHHQNCVVTPHIAWNSVEADKRLADGLFSGVQDALNSATTRAQP
ncbi:MAG: NAD(P)-dependent oxidoreductase [Planctomycetota bacterium]